MPTESQIITEQIIRGLITDNPTLPIRGDFYRGPNPNRSNPLAEPTIHEYVDSPACGNEWFVRVLPTLSDVCVSAAGRYDWGYNDVIGEVTVVKLPQSSPGVVDLDALRSPRFKVELLAAIREKAAVVEQMRAEITA